MRADAYMSVTFIKLTAALINIDAEKNGFGAKIPSP